MVICDIGIRLILQRSIVMHCKIYYFNYYFTGNVYWMLGTATDTIDIQSTQRSKDRSFLLLYVRKLFYCFYCFIVSFIVENCYRNNKLCFVDESKLKVRKPTTNVQGHTSGDSLKLKDWEALLKNAHSTYCNSGNIRYITQVYYSTFVLDVVRERCWYIEYVYPDILDVTHMS